MVMSRKNYFKKSIPGYSSVEANQRNSSSDENLQLYQVRRAVDDISNLPGVQLTQTKKTNQGKKDQGKANIL